MIDRRDFLKTVSQSAVAVAASSCAGRTPRLVPAGPAAGGRHALADLALHEATRLGASYADVRFTSAALHRLYLLDLKTAADEELETVGRASGFGVRVLVEQAWGFASSDRDDADGVQAAVRRAVDIAAAEAKRPDHRPVTLVAAPRAEITRRLAGHRDPASVPHEPKIAALLRINERLLKVPGIIHANVSVRFDHEWRLLATTDGTRIDEETGRVFSQVTAHAQKGRRLRKRTYVSAPRAGGFEAFDPEALLAQCDRLADEAVAKCTAAFFDDHEVDLIATSSHMVLPLHICVALPTEIDRSVGPRGDGESFLRPADIGSRRYGPPLLNVNGGANAGRAYDDEGVKRDRFPMIRDGVLVGVQTTRDTAGAASASASTGCAYAVSWAHAPLLRSSALSIEPDARAGSLADLIADTKVGVLVDGLGAWHSSASGSFESKADAAWEIRNGRIVSMLDDIRYAAKATDLFGAINAVTGTAETSVTAHDAKGAPAQLLEHEHRAPAVRFNGIRVASGSRHGF